MKKISFLLCLMSLVLCLANCAGNSQEPVDAPVAEHASTEVPTTDSATVVVEPPTAEPPHEEPENCLSTIHGDCVGGSDLNQAEPETGFHTSIQD